MAGLKLCRTYTDDLLIISRGNFDQHLEHLEQVLTWLVEAGLKIIATKSLFCRSKLKYLSYWIICKGIRPVAKKVEAILKIKTSTNQKELRQFIEMINYYRDI